MVLDRKGFYRQIQLNKGGGCAVEMGYELWLGQHRCFPVIEIPPVSTKEIFGRRKETIGSETFSC